jgi:hypothetical protein
MTEPKDGIGSLGFVTRELERAATALREPQPPERYSQLYLIQQTLTWSLDPENFMSPMEAIRRPGAIPAMEGIPEGSEGYSAARRRIGS